MGFLKWIVVLLTPVALVAAVWAGDRLLTRPDRAVVERVKGDLLTVQDALLRFEYEHGYLPEELSALVPLYLRQDHLVGGREDTYVYERSARRLIRAEALTVRGIWQREIRLERALPAAPDLQDVFLLEETVDQLLVPVGPSLTQPPDGAFVFEGEWYSEMTYGWEVRADPASSRGAYIHCKEGIGNGPGQIHSGVYDFYNIEESAEYSSLSYHIRIPTAGRYYLYGRMWTTGSHCSNIVIAGVNTTDPSTASSGDYAGASMANTTPFRWVWTAAGDRPHYLEAGDHKIHIFIHEDGIRLDQLALSPMPLEGDTAYEPNLYPNRGTAFAAAAETPVDLTFDLESVVLEPACPPRGNLVLRRVLPAEGLLMVDIYLDEAPTGREDGRLRHYELPLESLPEIAFLPLGLEGLELEGLPRREYLLRAVAKLGGEVVAECHVPLMRPFAWEVSPVFDFLEVNAKGPLDPGIAADAVEWTPLACDKFDVFGVLDFGLQTTGNSLHASQWKTIYARTSIEVPTAGHYLFKIQSDDQMLLWIDGKLLHRHEQRAPVTRSAARPKISLGAGRHTMLMRVNQAGESAWHDGRWQATVRIRTLDDRLSTVFGN